jgi:hypothetical protein
MSKVSYFVAWMQEDNPNDRWGEKLLYRVFRDEGTSKEEPVTEAMTRNEANEKLKEILTVLGELDGHRQGRTQA